MQQVQEQLVLAKDDHQIIMGYLKMGGAKTKISPQEAESLEKELKKAKLVATNAVPDDVVRLNSIVTIKDEATGKIMELVVVTPERADIKLKKISIMSPIGTALIGFKKGSIINWDVPAGKKTFRILDVTKPVE
jgi:regulator of nucleoside diphosphate kinase